jgi:hypothetical protein
MAAIDVRGILRAVAAANAIVLGASMRRRERKDMK